MISPPIATPLEITNRSHRLEHVIFNDRRSDYDEIYENFIVYKPTITTPKSLNSIFNDFITCNDVNDAQSITLHKTMSYLQQFLNPTLLSSITLGKATDDEVVVYRKSNNGFYNVVIDTEGDVMVSFSGYTERGWRKFYDQDEFIPASHINDFFSI